jgi:NAD(P)-dependent dehydrogenase (short-subunit alcohol dehydrogenase family)
MHRSGFGRAPTHWFSTVAEAAQKLGGLDILVCNAGPRAPPDQNEAGNSATPMIVALSVVPNHV